MYSINVFFEDEECKKLDKMKGKTQLSWHDFFMLLIKLNKKKVEELKNE